MLRAVEQAVDMRLLALLLAAVAIVGISCPEDLDLAWRGFRRPEETS